MTRIGKAALGLVVSLLAACGGWERIAGSKSPGPGNAYTIDLPLGWVRMTQQTGEVVVTRDGPGLQAIVMKRIPNKRAFQKGKKSIAPDILPSELAELEIAEWKARNEQLAALTVLDNSPALVGGQLAYRIQFRYYNDSGLPFDNIIYGFADKDYYHTILFSAPGLHYFGKYQGDFENAVLSVRMSQQS